MSFAPPQARLAGLDAARGLAVLAMFAFHFIWDLGYFGYIDADFPYSRGVKAFGHVIAFAFLFIAGVSLVLAREKGAGWRLFWRRLALVGGAAALVSAVTYAAFPQSYVFFGILHCIAASSLLAAPFLLLPWPAALAAAAVAGAAPLFLQHAEFDARWLQWVGLSTLTPLTNDYRPLFPWAGALLAGVAAMKAARAVRGRASGLAPLRSLTFLGRHSLLLYVVHQPALFAAFSAVALLSAPHEDATQDFVAACETQCGSTGAAAATCRAACVCTAEEVSRRGALEGVADAAERARRIDEIARECLAKGR
jgi:uncharacterized membrane protein